MAANETVLTAGEESLFLSNKILGIAAIIAAPMLLAETLIRVYAPATADASARFFGFLEFTYIVGWICGAVGMRRLRVTGDGRGARILFFVQIAGLVLASLLNVQEILDVRAEQTALFYHLTDAAYPFSHLLMIVVGVFTIKARVWRTLPQVVSPYLVGFALPVFFALSAAVGFEKALFVFPSLTMTGFLIIGFSLFKNTSVLADN